MWRCVTLAARRIGPTTRNTRMMTESDLYGRGFYAWIAESSRRAAATVVPIVTTLTNVESVVDIGCGTGGWLSVFVEHGVHDVVGVDDPRVPSSLRRIPPDRFVEADLIDPPDLCRRFDLALSLEVAEHLPPASAAGFVEYLCSLAPVVLFSAAIPGQEGEGHLNEQWPAYWCELFARHSFVSLDVVRATIWEDDAVDWFYRQNLLLYVHESHEHLIRIPDDSTILPRPPLPLVHPLTWSSYRRRVDRWVSTPLSLRALLGQLPGAARAAAGRRVPGRRR